LFDATSLQCNEFLQGGYNLVFWSLVMILFPLDVYELYCYFCYPQNQNMSNHMLVRQMVQYVMTLT